MADADGAKMNEKDEEEAFEEYETYDSISCIAIEIQYQQYLRSSKSSPILNKVNFNIGAAIDFDAFVETRSNMQYQTKMYRVRRLDKKDLEEEDVFRPIGNQRYTNAENFRVKDSQGKLLDSSAYAWLVKNYVEAHGMEISKRDLYDGLLNEIYSHEKRKCGLIKECFDLRMAAWQLLLKIGGLGPGESLDQKIDPTVFHDANNPLSKLVVYLYTMESFFQELLLNTQIDQNETKLLNLGPYALSLRSILYGASEERDDVPKEEFTAYRSFLIDEAQLNHFKNMQKSKKKVSLFGFTSATLSESDALS